MLALTLVVELHGGHDDEHALVPARPDPPVALGGRGVQPGEVGRLQDAEAVLRVERAVVAWKETDGGEQRWRLSRGTARAGGCSLRANKLYLLGL